MADNRSAASKYPSKFGASRWVTAAQWLAEMMCERRARHERKVLPIGFWKDARWAAVYRQQVAAANRLFALLDPGRTGTGAAAVSRFLRSARGKTAYSLMGAWLVPHVEAEHRKVVAERERAAAAPPPEPARPADAPPEKPREPFVRGESLLSKLRALD